MYGGWGGYFRLKEPRISGLQGPKERTVFHMAEQWLGPLHCFKALMSDPGKFKLVKLTYQIFLPFPVFLVPLLHPPPK